MWIWTELAQHRERVARLTEEISGLRATIKHTASVEEDAAPDSRWKDALGEIAALAGGHESEIQRLRDQVKRLEIALAEGIEHEERRERRIKASVRRARAQLTELGAEDPALEAEWDALPQSDGDGGEAEGVPPVSKEMGADPLDGPSSVPGVSIRQLRYARGIG